MRLLDEQPQHAAQIDVLLEEAFGPDRNKKTVYRLREGVEPVSALSVVAEDEDGGLLGTIRYWPISIRSGAGPVDALLLGPLAVHGGLRKTGVGTRLIQETLERARAQGHRIVLLVGDEPYYGRFGFRRDLAESLALPGPVDLSRFLGLELQAGALRGVAGMVEPAAHPPGDPERKDEPAASEDLHKALCLG